MKIDTSKITEKLNGNKYEMLTSPILNSISKTGSETLQNSVSQTNEITDGNNYEILTSSIFKSNTKTNSENAENNAANSNSMKNQGGIERNAFDQVGVRAHNVFRKIHGVADLQLDAQMSEAAQKYAVYLAAIQTLKHAELADVGENLAYACHSDGREMSAAEAVKNW